MRQLGTGPLLRLLVIGDSTAAGVGVTYIRDALPPQLAAVPAARRGCMVAWTVWARTGATASVRAAETVPSAPLEQDIALVLVGVNDVLKMTPRQRHGVPAWIGWSTRSRSTCGLVGK